MIFLIEQYLDNFEEEASSGEIEEALTAETLLQHHSTVMLHDTLKQLHRNDFLGFDYPLQSLTQLVTEPGYTLDLYDCDESLTDFTHSHLENAL